MAAAVLALLSTGTASTAAAADDGVANRQAVPVARGWPAQMLATVNDLRGRAGVAPLRLCPLLSSAARSHAREMARTGAFSHEGSSGDTFLDRMVAAGYRARTAGENLAAGQRTPTDAMAAWLASPAHYAVLTNPRFRHVGFALALAPTGEYRTFWVQDFAAGGRC